MEVAILGRMGCHLCEVVEAEIRSMKDIGAKITVVDIDGDAVLHDRYWLRIPVVTVDGREVFEASMMDAGGLWRKRLAAALGQ